MTVPDIEQVSSATEIGHHQQLNTNWVTTFEVDWSVVERIPGLRKAITQNIRPGRNDMNNFIRVGNSSQSMNCFNRFSLQSVFRQMQQYQRNCSLQTCAIVAEQIVRKYPACFLDVDDEGKQRGCGYSGLAERIRSRFSESTRGDQTCRLRSHRASRRVTTPNSSSNTQKSRASTYGCIAANPELPLGETLDTMEMKRRTLIQLYGTEGACPVNQGQVSDYCHFQYDACNVIIIDFRLMI